MKLPQPAPGLVVRYSFLWKEDYDKGKYEASKDRPCAIILATKVKDTKAIQVVVVPITHSEPDQADQSASLEMPAAIAKSLGLDAKRHWLRLTQLNRFIWPGYDLRPLPDVSRRLRVHPRGVLQPGQSCDHCRKQQEEALFHTARRLASACLRRFITRARLHISE